MQRVLMQPSGSRASALGAASGGGWLRSSGARGCAALVTGCALALSAQTALAVERSDVERSDVERSDVERSDVERGTNASASAGGVASVAPGREASSSAMLPTWARAYAQGQWSAAIELLETIPEASRTAWHWLHLARALEKRTQLVEAFGAYERLLDVAAEGAGLPGMKDVERQARAESSQLSNRMPWAEVELGRGLPVGALVFVDQQWLEPARLRSPYPVNPGWHTFLVESNGEVLAARRTYFEEGQSRVIPLAPLAEHPVADAPETPSVAASGVSTYGAPVARERSPRRPILSWRPEAQTIEADRRDNLMRASYVSLSIGALGAAVGTGLTFAASSSNDRGDIGYATLSYGVGFAALITGGVLWALHRDAARSSVNVANVELEPSIYPGGAAVRGTF
jgi:hypothetical protein